MALFVNEAPILGDATVVRTPATAVSDAKIQVEEFVAIVNLAAASTANQDVFIAAPGQNYQVTGVTATFGTASTSGTLDVVKCTGTTAVSAGTSIMTGTISLAGTANTPQHGTLSSTVSGLQLAGAANGASSGGDRLGIKLGGTLTSLADCLVQIRLKRI